MSRSGWILGLVAVSDQGGTRIVMSVVCVRCRLFVERTQRGRMAECSSDTIQSTIRTLRMFIAA